MSWKGNQHILGYWRKKIPFASYFCHKTVFACNSFGQLQLRLEGVGHRPTALTFARHRRCVHFLGDGESSPHCCILALIEREMAHGECVLSV